MTCSTLDSAELDTERMTRSPAATGIWNMWQVTVRGRSGWFLLLGLFAALELADIVTTNLGLGIPGNWEANPLMALSQAHLGVLWWIPKAIAVLLVCLAAPFTRRRWFMVLAICYCTITVLGNLLNL